MLACKRINKTSSRGKNLCATGSDPPLRIHLMVKEQSGTGIIPIFVTAIPWLLFLFSNSIQDFLFRNNNLIWIGFERGWELTLYLEIKHTDEADKMNKRRHSNAVICYQKQTTAQPFKCLITHPINNQISPKINPLNFIHVHNFQPWNTISH